MKRKTKKTKSKYRYVNFYCDECGKTVRSRLPVGVPMIGNICICSDCK